MAKNRVQRCSERGTPHDHHRFAVEGVGKSPWMHLKKDAEAWASAKRLQRASFALPVLGVREVARLTFQEYVQQRYIEERVLKRSTRENYDARLRVHVYPLIGSTRLSALTPTRMRQVYAALSRSGLSDRTVRGIWLIVASVLKQIAEDGMWDRRSPARNIRPRGVQRRAGVRRVQRN